MGLSCPPTVVKCPTTASQFWLRSCSQSVCRAPHANRPKIRSCSDRSSGLSINTLTHSVTQSLSRLTSPHPHLPSPPLPSPHLSSPHLAHSLTHPLTHPPHCNSNSKSNRNGLLGATPGNAPPPGARDRNRNGLLGATPGNAPAAWRRRPQPQRATGSHPGKRTAAGSRRPQPQRATGGHPGKSTAAGSRRLSPNGFYLPDRNPFRQSLIREKTEEIE